MDSKSDKIDFDYIRDMFNLKNKRNFEFYVENIFPDLCTFDENKNLGVSKVKFFDFIKLPIFISEKLFISMDKNKDGFLSSEEMIKPLSALYFGSYEETAKFLFQIYDFDHDKLITPMDVKLILSYLPLKTDKTKTMYKYQMESLLELDELIKTFFNDRKTMNLDDFTKEVQVKSDIYLQLLCYLYQRCPFQEKSITVVSKSSSSSIKGLIDNPKSVNSPKSNKNSDGKLTPKAKKSDDGRITPKNRGSSSNIVLNSPSEKTKLSPACEFLKLDEDDVRTKPKRKFDSFSNQESPEMSGYKGMIHYEPQKEQVLPKSKSSFKNSEKTVDHDDDIVIKKTSKGHKLMKKILPNENKDKSKTKFVTKDSGRVSDEEDDREKITITVEDEEEDEEDDEEDHTKNIIFQGPIMKFSKKANSVKSFFMTILGEDIYYYTDETKTDLKHVHNLSGCFIKENGEELVGKLMYYSFSIIFLNKVRNFLLKDRTIAKEWTKSLRQVIGYKNFFDFYEMLDDLGEGQFGLVKLGINIKTKEKVAIKIIKKSKMKPAEASLVKIEIDVLQVCRHPCIVQFLDHFENSEYIFIVMEYIKCGHLRQYLLKYKFNISEKQASKIAYQIASGLKYLNSFGVIHRDLKPDNVMVADVGSNIHVKIMDFGLSKIIGPREKAEEGYGTLCFVAPEIILREPYNNSVDIWSLGVMMFYILTGDLPFDDPNNNEKAIARQIVYEEPTYSENKWKNKSREAKQYVKDCLVKDLKKRITIDKLIEHNWMKVMEKVKD